jgi:riboflavin synthase alpha subunit
MANLVKSIYTAGNVTAIGELTSSDTVNLPGTLTLDGNLQGPASFVIDPATHGDNTGTVVVAGDLTINGTLRNNTGNFVIDPNPDGTTGTLVVNGNLQVDGTTTTINSTTLTVDDKNIVLASGAADAVTADGAGITIDGASATFTYSNTGDKFVSNKSIFVDQSELASTGKSIAMAMVFG